MAGDGVSLPTTLAQLGNVAKAQARATAVSQPTTPFADLAEQKGVVKAHRVQETQAQTADHKVDPDHDGLDKRQRRRQKRLGRNGIRRRRATPPTTPGTKTMHRRWAIWSI
ncbi:MAG: hypothetical protein IPI48_09195 [bacterium]|nr:hypothetical protein [bacterium]